jgi:hypothetical protein
MNRVKSAMLEFAKIVHEAIGIQSPRVFIAVFALFGLLFFGGIGWLIDRGYRVKLQEAKSIQLAPAAPAAPTKPANDKSAIVGVMVPERREVLLDASKASLKIEVGDSNTFFTAGTPIRQPWFQMFRDNQLTIERINGQVVISTAVRDSSGAIVAEVIRNQWKVRPELLWDKNFNRNALEIRDKFGDVVLQIVVLEDRIRIQGVWRSSSGDCFMMVKNPDPKNPGASLITFYNPTIKIKPIFLYPSELHPGELAEVHTPHTVAPFTPKTEDKAADKQRPNQIMNNSPGGVQVGGDLKIVSNEPRFLSAEQKSKLAQEISNFSPQEIEITRFMSSDDALGYGADIGNAILAGGWTVKGNAINMAVATAFDGVRGLSILVKDASAPPLKARQLQQAMIAAKIPVTLASDSSLSADVIVLWVGSR